MKNQLIPFVFVATLLLTSMACNKEDVNSFRAEDISHATDVQPVLYQADLVFHLSEVDLKSGLETGWVIDRLGKVRAYERTEANTEVGVPGNNVISTTEMNVINKMAQEVLFEISKNDLDEMTSLLSKVDPNALTDTEKGPNSESSVTIYAYRMMASETPESYGQDEGYSVSDNEEESCGGQLHSNSYLTGNQYEQLIISTEGTSARQNTSEASEAIGTWMADLNNKNNL